MPCVVGENVAWGGRCGKVWRSNRELPCGSAIQSWGSKSGKLGLQRLHGRGRHSSTVHRGQRQKRPKCRSMDVDKQNGASPESGMDTF